MSPAPASPAARKLVMRELRTSDDGRETVRFRILPVEHQDVADGFDLDRAVMGAEIARQFPFFGLWQGRNAQLDQFVACQRAIDLRMLVSAEPLLADRHHGFQPAAMTFGT